MMSEIDAIKVNTSPSYDVVISCGVLDSIGEFLKERLKANRVLVVTDTNVAPLYLDRVLSALKNAEYSAYSHVVNSGEQYKNAKTYLDIIDALGKNGFKRTDAVIALGGGVVGDMAGFASATYMRGIDVVQVPTTLLAMIDSSIGGKTGVDLTYGKNLLGAFHQPKCVIADLNTLETLPEREWQNGVGEGVKYACLEGGRIAMIMSQGLDKDNLKEFIKLCAEYKARVVAADEKESGLRKLLNLGHTLGHAIEKQSDFKIAHGMAVAKGISLMAGAALRHGELSKAEFDKIIKMLENCGVKNVPTVDKEMLSAVVMDKKAEGENSISVVKIRGIGKCEIEKVTFREFENYLLK